MRHPRLLLALLVLTTALACDDKKKTKSGDDVVKRPGQPDYVKSKDNAVLERAVAKAKQTQGDFRSALAAPKPSHKAFAIKKPFPTPAGHEEHIWLNDVRWDGTSYRAVVNNEPVDTKAVKLGDAVTVKPEEISDWMYLDGKRLVGGYTIRALHAEMPEAQRKEFTEQTGMEVPPVDF
jgi:uncharacterized protein YegJ (DUF2314 family)